MNTKKIILLKLSGEVLRSESGSLDGSLITAIAQQIIHLRNNYYFGIVIGGGNFFRGSREGTKLGITPSVGHQIGMLATMMNGLIIRDLFEQQGIQSSLFCAVPSPEIGMPISQQALEKARNREHCIIFTGGTGNPFFTTDTTAILRALQLGAYEVWKGTSVEGVFSSDPKLDPSAAFIQKTTHKEALAQSLGIMDATAFAMAQLYHLTIRVFNIFEKNALLRAAEDKHFGSTITS